MENRQGKHGAQQRNPALPASRLCAFGIGAFEEALSFLRRI
ncbi:hypothetical protein ACFPME_07770 [Rhodanobacter umsongensis]|uniref:Uncharacterized protein n=1 Tax=Rhodanobacter umsongensis TaxID=633153 RepID=A0ABW0JL51_9GAMM